jgi:hypothetical protein
MTSLFPLKLLEAGNGILRVSITMDGFACSYSSLRSHPNGDGILDSFRGREINDGNIE